MTHLNDVDRVEFFHEHVSVHPDAVPVPVGDLRWRYIAAGNSATMAGPGEGYKHLGDMIADVERVTHRRLTHDLELAANMPTIHIFWSWDQPQRYATGLASYASGGMLPREQGMA